MRSTHRCVCQRCYIVLNTIQVLIQAILESCVKQDAYRALHDLLRAMDHLFGTRPEVICQLKLQIAMHVSENLLYDEFGIQGVSAKLSLLQIA